MFISNALRNWLKTVDRFCFNIPSSVQPVAQTALFPALPVSRNGNCKSDETGRQS